MSRGRRIKPRTREGRKRAAELGRIISSPRTLKADREAALRELDSIAPVLGSLSGTEDSKPTREDLERLIERVEAKQASGSLSGSSLAGEHISESGTPVPTKPQVGSPSERSILSAEEIRAKVEAWTHQLVPYARENALRKAKSAPDSERAAAILTEYPEHPLNKLGVELARYLWQEDKSSRKPDVEQMALWKVQGWLEKRPYNGHDIRGNVETVAAAVADVFRLLAEKDAAEPDWFVKRAEKLFDAPSPEPTGTLAAEPAVDIAPLSAPALFTPPPGPRTCWHR